MEAFKKELNTLLDKYPELPEFTLTVRPRIVIESKSNVASQVPVNVGYVPTAQAVPGLVVPTTVAQTPTMAAAQATIDRLRSTNNMTITESEG